MAERGAQRRQPLDNFGEPLFGGTVERGAGPAEADVIALEDALLLRVQSGRIASARQRIDAAEQGGVGVNLVPMARNTRRHFALDVEQRAVAMGADQEVKDIFHPLQRAAASFQRLDGIGEIGRGARAGNFGDLSVVLG